MNKLIFIDNVGRDPDMRYTPSGQAVTSFSVASNHRYKTASGEQREETTWFNCQAWGKLAEITNEQGALPDSYGQRVPLEVSRHAKARVTAMKVSPVRNA